MRPLLVPGGSADSLRAEGVLWMGVQVPTRPRRHSYIFRHLGRISGRIHAICSGEVDVVLGKYGDIDRAASADAQNNSYP